MCNKNYFQKVAPAFKLRRQQTPNQEQLVLLICPQSYRVLLCILTDRLSWCSATNHLDYELQPLEFEKQLHWELAACATSVTTIFLYLV